MQAPTLLIPTKPDCRRDATGISSVPTRSIDAINNDAWYTIDGRRINGKPDNRGIYIIRGQKVYVKKF